MVKMKTVLIELLAFALICAFGTAAGGFLIMIYHSVTSLVAGADLTLFNAQSFINGAIAFFPILLLFVPMFLFLSLVRHPRYNKVSGALTIAVLSLAAWIFVAPISYKLGQSQSAGFDEQPPSLTAGYFRTINKRLYYFTFATGNYVKGIRIDEGNSSNKKTDRSIKILDNNYINVKRDSLGFSDPIIGEALTPPPILLNFLNGMTLIQKNASEACMAGKLEWLLFSSLMLALAAIGAIISASEWKLADAFYITFDTFAILTVNCFFFQGRFAPIVSAIESLGGFARIISGNFQCALNCAIIFALVVLGSVKSIVHAGKKRRSGK